MHVLRPSSRGSLLRGAESERKPISEMLRCYGALPGERTAPARRQPSQLSTAEHTVTPRYFRSPILLKELMSS